MKKQYIIFIIFSAAFLFISFSGLAQELSATPNEVTFKLGLEGSSFSKAINILLLMTFLALVPSIIMMMTSYMRIVIVLSLLKQAMAVQSAPSPKVIAALAIFLSIFIMHPVWTEIYDTAIVPYSEQQMDEKTAITQGTVPLKNFMIRQTRDSSLILFMEMADLEPVDDPEKLPLTIVIPAFMLSELKTAFQMGFLIYLPFLVVDVVVATTLMSMGMMMLPPMMISVPFKLLLFIIVDGWSLMIKSLITSFN